MDNFSNPAGPSAENFGYLTDMEFDSLTMPTKRHYKELARPSMELYKSSSELYISPEEMQPDRSYDDTHGWNFTDDDQMDTDDDMDGNEFDTDFAECDFPSPPEEGLVGTSTERTQFVRPNYLSSCTNNSFVNANIPASSQYFPDSRPVSRNNTDRSYCDRNYNGMTYNGSGPLETHRRHGIFTQHGDPDATSLQQPAPGYVPYIPNASPHNNVAPHIEDPRQLEIGLGDLDMEIGLDDIYAPFALFGDELKVEPDLATLAVTPATSVDNTTRLAPQGYASRELSPHGSISVEQTQGDQGLDVSYPTVVPAPELASNPPRVNSMLPADAYFNEHIASSYSPNLASALTGDIKPDSYELDDQNAALDAFSRDIEANLSQMDGYIVPTRRHDRQATTPPPLVNPDAGSPAKGPEEVSLNLNAPFAALPASLTGGGTPTQADAPAEATRESELAESSTAVTSPISPPASPDDRPRRKVVYRKTSRDMAGPHTCTMTYQDGTSCNRSFTRPYDLARHQETLHAAVRKMYTCEACGQSSKTFSRLDALSRHMRMKHS